VKKSLSRHGVGHARAAQDGELSVAKEINAHGNGGAAASAENDGVPPRLVFTRRVAGCKSNRVASTE
jgi:hypothetical protein